MMITTDIRPRTGLNTATGQRNAPRLAGGPLTQAKETVSYRVGGGTLEERVKALQKKQEEDNRYKEITRRNLQKVDAGESPEQSLGGSIAVADSAIDKTAKGVATGLSTAGNAYRQRMADENNAAADAKARGLGQYKGQADSTVLDYGMGQDTPFKARMALQAAADDAAAAAKLEAQRNNNRISAKTAADAASAADNAYSQRYAAAQAADAQKFASTMQMFGGLTSPGAYKYWGG